MTNVLKEVRTKKGVSVSELAKKAGVSRQTIYNIEADENAAVTSVVMEGIAAALGVKVTKIFLF